MVLAGCLALARGAVAQVGASIEGVVRDESGGVIAHAAVSAQNDETGQVREAVSDASGRYQIFDLFNTTNYSGFFNFGASGVRPDANGTLAFQPTIAGPPRQFQFAARVTF